MLKMCEGGMCNVGDVLQPNLWTRSFSSPHVYDRALRPWLQAMEPCRPLDKLEPMSNHRSVHGGPSSSQALRKLFAMLQGRRPRKRRRPRRRPRQPPRRPRRHQQPTRSESAVIRIGSCCSSCGPRQNSPALHQRSDIMSHDSSCHRPSRACGVRVLQCTYIQHSSVQHSQLYSSQRALFSKQYTTPLSLRPSCRPSTVPSRVKRNRPLLETRLDFSRFWDRNGACTTAKGHRNDRYRTVT